MAKMNSDDGLIYACGTGRQKRWAREKLIMDMLYTTEDDYCTYLKFKDLELLGEPDDEIGEKMLFRFGYLFRSPRTEIDLIVNKKTGLMYLKRDEIGWGWDEVEKEVYKFIELQIKKKNVYIQTNLNCEEFLIK